MAALKALPPGTAPPGLFLTGADAGGGHLDPPRTEFLPV